MGYKRSKCFSSKWQLGSGALKKEGSLVNRSEGGMAFPERGGQVLLLVYDTWNKPHFLIFKPYSNVNEKMYLLNANARPGIPLVTGI